MTLCTVSHPYSNFLPSATSFFRFSGAVGLDLFYARSDSFPTPAVDSHLFSYLFRGSVRVSLQMD